MSVVEPWRKWLSRSDPGEVGRVYYLNVALLFADGNDEWTMCQPFTLNPEYGRTIEEMLKSSKVIPKHMRSGLLTNRETSVKLETGQTWRMWISDAPAPTRWAPEVQERISQEKLKRQDKPTLYDHQGKEI